LYYKTAISKTIGLAVDVISGCKNSALFNTVYTATTQDDVIVKINVEAQIVQTNRYQEVWGISRYPRE
jgi:nicotinamide riboside transporter PnuC